MKSWNDHVRENLEQAKMSIDRSHSLKGYDVKRLEFAVKKIRDALDIIHRSKQ